MSDLSPESADLALARHLLTTHALTALVETDLSLRRALVEVSRALDGAGASLDERLLASVAISDALRPLRDAIAVLRAGACRCGEKVAVVRPLRKLALVRKAPTNADCLLALSDDGRDPEGAA
jgi:hypothetical protein